MAIVVVSTAAQVAGPALIAYGIDQGLPALLEGDWMPVGFAGVAYLLTGAVGAFLIAWYIRLSARISQAVLLDLRTRVFLHTQKLSLEFHESYTSGRIISRQTSDLDAIRELLDEGINQLVRGALYMSFTAVALALLDWTSALVLLVALVPLAVLTRWFQVRSQRLFRRSRVASASLIVHFVESMTGIRAVQAFRKERRNEREFGDLVEDYRDVNAKVIQLFGIYDPGLLLIGNACVAAVLVVGGFRVVDGGMEVGVLLAAVLYTKRFFDPMEDMAMFYNGYQSAASALEKISGVLEEEPSVPDPLHPVDLWKAHGNVRFEGVEFAYTPDRVILPRLRPRHPGGADGGAGGVDGRRQVDAREAHRALLRPERRRGRARRGRPALAAPEGPAPRDRHGHAGGVPVLGVGRRQHRARPARRVVRRHRARPRRRWARTSSSRGCRTATTPT